MAYTFIDTNVLMQFRMFDQVDWAKELRVPEVTLVFAPIVFSELDKYKWAGTRRQKERARAVLKKLLALQLSTTPVDVGRAIKAIALDEEPADTLFVQHRVQPQCADDQLLASYFGFAAAHARERVLVLSADAGLATKARSRRIEIAAPSEALELPDEPDEVMRELEKARRELAEIKNAAPDLSLTFGGGSTHEQFEVRPVHAIDYRTREKLLTAWRRRYPYTKATDETIELPGGQKFSFGSLAGLPGYMSAEDAAKYNAAVDGVFARYEAFLSGWPDTVNAYRRIVPFNLVLENSGSAPAIDVNVQFWTDAPGAWRYDLLQVPMVAPGLKKARSPFELVSSFSLLDRMPNLQLPTINANEDGPSISEGPEQKVQYAVKRVIHHVPCELPKVYFQFDSDEAIGSFRVDVRLVAANIPKPHTNTLNVEVTRGEPVSPPPPPDPGDDSD